MPAVPAKVQQRLQTELKRFQGVLEQAKVRDVNEADTVTIVTDMLSNVFGYDKYTEVTSEYAIRGTYVDLAIKLDGKPHLLVEVKAIGLSLDERHTKQAIDYAANQGVEWVILTNGLNWRVYRVTFGKPIGQELVADIDMLGLSARAKGALDNLYPLTREGSLKSALQEFHEQRQATNRYVIGAILQADSALEVVRREVRRLNPGVRLDLDEVRAIVTQEVLKREVVEGEKATEAKQKVRKASSRRLRVATPQDDEKPVEEPVQ